MLVQLHLNHLNSHLLTNKIKITNQKTESLITNKEVVLSSFNSIGRSLVSFSGTNAQGSNLAKIMAEIENTKNSIRILENETNEQGEEVKTAYSKIAAHKWWESVDAERYKQAQKIANVAKEKEDKSHLWGTRWLTSNGSSVYSDKMNEYYWNDYYKYHLNIWDYERYNNIINAYEIATKSSNESKARELKALKQKLSALEKNIDFASLQDSVNASMNSIGGLEDSIAGYEDIKDEIKRAFIEPLKASTVDEKNEIRVPSAIMLYGATGCGKTEVLNAIQRQTKDFARVVRFDSANDEGRSFKNRIEKVLKEARIHYLKTRGNGVPQRTIILINEAESYFCLNEADIEKSGMLFESDDLEKIRTYTLQETDEQVRFFKSLLDYISLPPDASEEKCKGGFGATIFITSNYPHLIHRDLLSRDGEFGKMMKLPVRPPKDNDLRAVVKHYFKKYSDLIEQIKVCSKKENYADLIRSIPAISDKGKEVLIEKTRNGTIDNVAIDPTCGGFPNFDRFIKSNNPSLKEGAYSCARIRNIAQKAFIEYLKNPVISYETHFCNIKNQWGRDINPEAYRHFLNIYDMVENPQQFKNRQENSSISEDIQQLKQAYLDGNLTDRQMKIFEIKIKDIQEKYDKLKSKENLSGIEENILKQYEEFLTALNDEEMI